MSLFVSIVLNTFAGLFWIQHFKLKFFTGQIQQSLPREALSQLLLPELINQPNRAVVQATML